MSPLPGREFFHPDHDGGDENYGIDAIYGDGNDGNESYVCRYKIRKRSNFQF